MQRKLLICRPPSPLSVLAKRLCFRMIFKHVPVPLTPLRINRKQATPRDWLLLSYCGLPTLCSFL